MTDRVCIIHRTLLFKHPISSPKRSVLHQASLEIHETSNWIQVGSKRIRVCDSSIETYFRSENDGIDRIHHLSVDEYDRLMIDRSKECKWTVKVVKLRPNVLLDLANNFSSEVRSRFWTSTSKKVFFSSIDDFQCILHWVIKLGSKNTCDDQIRIVLLRWTASRVDSKRETIVKIFSDRDEKHINV